MECKKACPSSYSHSYFRYVLTKFLSSCGIKLALNLAPGDIIIKYAFDSRYLEYELLKFKESKADGTRLFPKFSSANLKRSSFKPPRHTGIWFATAARSCNKFPWIMLERCYTTQYQDSLETLVVSLCLKYMPLKRNMFSITVERIYATKLRDRSGVVYSHG